MPVNSQGTKTDVLLVTSLTDNSISMRTCFLLSHTHAHHKETHTHSRMCMLETADGERNRLTFYRKEKNGGRRWERKEKEKPGVILASKRKRQKVKSVLGVCFFLGGGGGKRRGALSGTEGCVNTLSGFACTQALQTRGIAVNWFLGGCGLLLKPARGQICNLGHTLLAQASSSHVVSCNTRMISLISALIFSKVNLRFLSASSVPPPRLLFVVTKIFMAEKDARLFLK